MSDVKRYWLHEIKAREGADINAEYALASDYDAIAAELAATKEQLRLCNIDQFNAEARVQSLEAELAEALEMTKRALVDAIVRITAEGF